MSVLHDRLMPRKAIFTALAVAMMRDGVALAAPVVDVEEVEVTAQRANLSSAQEIKRGKIEIVDAVVADDINKLPDHSLAEAMQRITSVQIARDRGEGSALQGFYSTTNALNSGVTIRGLPMIETLFNGREVFTAGGGRTFNFADVPAEMVSAISVYKTSSAEHIEGGLGGLVDLRTRHPFDFSGRRVVLKAGLMRGDLAEETTPEFSLLASDRWETSAGEFGALFDVGYQKRSYHEDYMTSSTAVVGGIALPTTLTQVTNVGERKRFGISTILQWRPTERLELYAEAHHTQLKTIEDATVLSIGINPGTATPGNIVLFPGTQDAASVTWNAGSVSSTGQARDTLDRNTQLAVGGSWVGDALLLKADVSHTRSDNSLRYSALNLSGAAASNITHRVSPGAAANASMTSSNLLNAASFTGAAEWYSYVPFEGDMTAVQVDGEYQVSGRLLDAVAAGVRYAARGANDQQGVLSDFPSVSVANASAALVVNPYTNSLSGLNSFLVGSPALARDVVALRQQLGISAALPSSNPLGTWEMAEKTHSAYVMAKLKSADVPFDGNVGVRLVRTEASLHGFQGSSNATAQPLDTNQSYFDILPGVNLRYELSRGLYLRGAASKTVTRPDFNKLSPSLTLNLAQLKGGAGNPALQPMHADNYDVALEKYFDKTTSVYFTGFKKNVDGFITDVTMPEVWGGNTFDVTRPYNTGTSKIRGVEVGYQQFYDFLPGWLGGLGLQANYTYIDSRVENSSLPLAGLSRNSYNLIGMYERGPMSVRVAYNWRGAYLTSVSGGVPVYMDAYGWLDASAHYRVSDRVTLAIEGSNLLDTERHTYYGSKTRPQTTWVNDTRISATVTIDF